MKRRVFLAFLLGFYQTIFGIWAEIVTVFYFTSLDNLMQLIMAYSAIVFITKFEDDYANSLVDNAIKKATGKKLKTEIKRRDFITNRH